MTSSASIVDMMTSMATASTYGQPSASSESKYETVSGNVVALGTSRASPPGGQQASFGVVTVLTIAMGFSGIIANGFVLFAVIFYKQVRKNSTNAYISNQIVLDLVACITLSFNTLSDGYGIINRVEGVGKWIICYLFASNTLFVVPTYASQVGLVIITVERYVKIVYPIAHRKYIRDWMTKAGVIVPWIVGIVSYLIPNWSTTRLIQGTCYSFYAFPKQMLQAYTVVIFILLLIIPLGIFTFCYSRIIVVVLRRKVQVSSAANTVHSQAHQSAVEAAKSAGSGRTKNKAVRTLLIVCTSYFISWFPIKFYILAATFRFVPVTANMFYGLTLLSYVNMLMNPVIYVTHFGIVSRTRDTARRCLRMLTRNGIATQVEMTIPTCTN